MLVLAHPEEGRGGTADGDEGSGTHGAAQGGGSDKGNRCGGHDGASVAESGGGDNKGDNEDDTEGSVHIWKHCHSMPRVLQMH